MFAYITSFILICILFRIWLYIKNYGSDVKSNPSSVKKIQPTRSNTFDDTHHVENVTGVVNEEKPEVTSNTHYVENITGVINEEKPEVTSRQEDNIGNSNRTTSQKDEEDKSCTIKPSSNLKRKVHEPVLKHSKSSSDWRKEGNISYAKAANHSLPPGLQKHHLTAALECYKQGLKECVAVEEEKCLLYKNIALSNKRYAEILSNNPVKDEQQEVFFKVAFQNYISALSYAEVKSAAWIQSLKESLTDTAIKAVIDAAVRIIDDSSHAAILHSYLFEVSQNPVRKLLLVDLICLEFDIGREAFHHKQYNSCIQQMHGCKRLLLDYKLLSGGVLETKYELKLDEVTVLTEISKSINHRIAGDEILQNLLERKTPLSKAHYDSVLAKFREAAKIATSFDIIAEATALSRLGHVYDILDEKKYATSYIEKCFASLEHVPKCQYVEEDWYKECLETLQRYKDSIIIHESDKWKVVRQQYLNQLETELKDLDQLSEKGHVKFLYNLYKKYPPKKQNNVLPLENEDENVSLEKLKKIYRKAKLHYSHDKVDTNIHGEKWKVFCEQVSVLLNSKADSI